MNKPLIRILSDTAATKAKNNMRNKRCIVEATCNLKQEVHELVEDVAHNWSEERLYNITHQAIKVAALALEISHRAEEKIGAEKTETKNKKN